MLAQEILLPGRKKYYDTLGSDVDHFVRYICQIWNSYPVGQNWIWNISCELFLSSNIAPARWASAIWKRKKREKFIPYGATPPCDKKFTVPHFPLLGIFLELKQEEGMVWLPSDIFLWKSYRNEREIFAYIYPWLGIGSPLPPSTVDEAE